MLQCTKLDKELIGNSGNDNVILLSLQEAFCRNYRTLSDELELKHKQASHVNKHDKDSSNGNNECLEELGRSFHQLS